MTSYHPSSGPNSAYDPKLDPRFAHLQPPLPEYATLDMKINLNGRDVAVTQEVQGNDGYSVRVSGYPSQREVLSANCTGPLFSNKVVYEPVAARDVKALETLIREAGLKGPITFQ